MTLSLTQMACFTPSSQCQNSSLVSPPTGQSQFSLAGDFILATEGTFDLQGSDATVSQKMDITIGWEAGGGPTGSGPDYGVSLQMWWNGTGARWISATFGPLTTPPGTQFHIEIGVNSSTGLLQAFENGVAMTRYHYVSGSPPFNIATLASMTLSYSTISGDGDGCIGNFGFYAGTITPTGTPYVYLAIPPGGTVADFFTNTGGIAGAFSPAGTTHLCTVCFGGTDGGGGPPPPTPKLALDNIIVTATTTLLSVNLVSLRWSDDRGHSYGSPVSQSIGEAGEYRTSLQWQRLAYARDRVFEISWSVPMRTALQGCWIDVTPAQS